MKILIKLPFGLLISLIFFSQSAFASVDVDFGTSVSYTAPKNDTYVSTVGGKSKEIKIKDKTDSASVYFIRGKVPVSFFKIGAGVLFGNEIHNIDDGIDTYKYKFDTTVFELLFGLPTSFVDVGLILGAGSKKYTLGKTEGGLIAVTKSFTVLEYGLYAAVPINVSGSLAIRVGVSYQAITGSEQNVDITYALASMKQSDAKVEHKVNPSASILGLTLGVEF